MTDARLDGRIERGNLTRAAILRHSTEIGSREGLEALSIGRIATALDLSKSGVFALFGSKEELQLATVRAATDTYVEHVIRPARELPSGDGRLRRLVEAWITYSKNRVFPGGCFFSSVSAEFDAREGRVHDAIAQAHRDWRRVVEHTVTEAIDVGDLRTDIDATQLTFEIIALLEQSNADSVLHGDESSYERASAAIDDRLRAASQNTAAP